MINICNERRSSLDCASLQYLRSRSCRKVVSFAHQLNHSEGCPRKGSRLLLSPHTMNGKFPFFFLVFSSIRQLLLALHSTPSYHSTTLKGTTTTILSLASTVVVFFFVVDGITSFLLLLVPESEPWLQPSGLKAGCHLI